MEDIKSEMKNRKLCFIFKFKNLIIVPTQDHVKLLFEILIGIRKKFTISITILPSSNNCDKVFILSCQYFTYVKCYVNFNSVIRYQSFCMLTILDSNILDYFWHCFFKPNASLDSFDINQSNSQLSTIRIPHYDLETISIALVKYKCLGNGKCPIGNTCIHQACILYSLNILEILLKYNHDINSTNVHKNTPLHLACLCGYLEIVKVLVKHGCNMECFNAGNFTALTLAAYGGYDEIVRFLLQSGASIHNLDNKIITNLFKISRHLASPSYNVRLLRLWPVKKEILLMFLYAGYNIHTDVIAYQIPPFIRSFKKKDFPNFKDIIELMVTLSSGPRTLVDNCTIKVRQLLGQDLQSKVKLLHIPLLLKDIVGLKTI